MSFLRSKNGGRLVQNENVGAPIEHLYDFHRLFFRNRHFIDLFVWIDLKAVFLAYFGNLFGGVFNVVFLVESQNYVFGRRENVHQLKMLMNHSYLIVERVFWGTNNDLFTVDEDVAFIGEVYSRNHIHKCSFSAAVFAEQRKNFAVFNRKVNIMISNHTAEPFGNAAKFDCNIVHKISP